jgi:hypothetical protein
MVKYAIFNILNPILYALVLWSDVRISVFCAKTKIKLTVTVTANFTTTKPERLELTNPANTGFASLAPKNMAPTTVVKQFIEPIKIKNKQLETFWLLCKTFLFLSLLRTKLQNCSRGIHYKGCQKRFAWGCRLVILVAFKMTNVECVFYVHCFE